MAEAQQEKEQVKEPSGVAEQLKKFQDEQAKETEESNPPSEDKTEAKQSDESQETESKEKETCETCGDDGDEKEEKAESKEDEKKPLYKVVNEQGEEVPLVVKADGKEHSIDDMEKLQKYLEQGIHASQKLEEANKLIGGNKQKEQELEQAIQETEKLMNKIEGKGKPSEESEDEDSLDDEEILDPDLKNERKARKGLEKQVKTLQQKLENVDQAFKKVTIASGMDKLNSDINKVVEKYPLAKDKKKEILGKMAEKDKSGNFVHDGVEGAVKAVHKERQQDFDAYIKEHPEYQKKSEEEIIKEYLANKEKKEKAPVSSPSEKPAKQESSSKKKEGFTGVADAMQQWRKSLSSVSKQAKKS